MAYRADDVVGAIGEIGRWQVRLILLLSLVGIECGWQVLLINFQAPPADHWCASPTAHGNQSQWRHLDPADQRTGVEREPSQCSSYIPDAGGATGATTRNNSTTPCNAWNYDTSEYSNTIIMEWDLVCERKWLQMLTQATYMIGIMFGVMFWGIAADRYGRRPTLFACIVLTSFLANLIAAAGSVEQFLVLRFLTAFCGIGAYTSSFVMSMELVGDRWRVLLGIAFFLPMSFSFIALSGIAYFIRDWRMLQLAVSLPSVLYVVYFLGGEAGAGRRAEACLDLITNGRMLAVTGCLFFGWFVNSLVFYGILLNTGDFGEDIYLNACLGGVVEIPAYALCTYATYRLGRRRPISCTMVGAGLACLLTLACEKGAYQYDWPIVSLAMISRFCITASFGSIYIYSAELFPTAVRNTGLASCSFAARFGGILAPLLLLLRDEVHPAFPVVVFGLAAMVAGLTILLLPETADRPLPECIADVEGK
ncbi:organic cation transporter protein-like [Pollicipes pollicipes]|uniref:organic cation transporter protein-like n=1 Tax=Pollicipes pollicipes TaxID=41117 RepID=UPI00188596CE|nr:organic cation transporter protein-like [Pollicipes pollicipes]